MKTKKLNKKLVLNKTTVADLEGRDMNRVRGGTNSVIVCTPTQRCNTSLADPCDCPTRVPNCNSTNADPCICI